MSIRYIKTTPSKAVNGRLSRRTRVRRRRHADVLLNIIMYSFETAPRKISRGQRSRFSPGNCSFVHALIWWPFFFSGRRVFRFSPSSRFCSFRKLLITTPARIAWKLYLFQRLKTKRRLMEAERGGTGSWRGAVVLHEYN